MLITRPRAEAEALARDVEARGHSVLVEPLLTIEPLPVGELDLRDVQAILLTSANAAPALTEPVCQLPVFAVGAATAQAARAAGARNVGSAAGDAVDLARLVARRCRPEDGVLLHLSGTEVRPALAEQLGAAGFALRRQAVYRARAATALSGAACQALRQTPAAAVLLFSPRTAGIFCDLVMRVGLERCLERATAICLSDAVAKHCQALPWRSVKVAARPDQGALLDQLDALGRRW